MVKRKLKPKPSEEPTGPHDRWAAIKQMMTTRGWKIFQEKIEAIGQDHLKEVLNVDLPPGKGYTKRDLHVHQCKVIDEVCLIPTIIEEEFNAFVASQPKKGEPHA